MDNPLDNIFWASLNGPLRPLTEGTGTVRRFAAGLSPLVAFADLQRPDFDALRALCAPAERVYCAGWSGAAPAGWRIELEGAIHMMVWDAPPPDADPGPAPVQLGPTHASPMVALAKLTHPGPFGPRNLELGDYLGRFTGDRLIAMAGERLRAGTLREISAVCTHPDAQGQGLARGLMNELIRRQIGRGETPVLHVLRSNTGAVGLYRRMGFRVRHDTLVRVVSRVAPD